MKPIYVLKILKYTFVYFGFFEELEIFPAPISRPTLLESEECLHFVKNPTIQQNRTHHLSNNKIVQFSHPLCRSIVFEKVNFRVWSVLRLEDGGWRGGARGGAGSGFERRCWRSRGEIMMVVMVMVVVVKSIGGDSEIMMVMVMRVVVAKSIGGDSDGDGGIEGV